MKLEGKKRPTGIAFILLTLFIDILGIGIIIPVLPALIREFGGFHRRLLGLWLGFSRLDGALHYCFRLHRCHDGARDPEHCGGQRRTV